MARGTNGHTHPETSTSSHSTSHTTHHKKADDDLEESSTTKDAASTSGASGETPAATTPQKQTTLSASLAFIHTTIAAFIAASAAIQALDLGIPATEDNAHTGNITPAHSAGYADLAAVVAARPGLFESVTADGTTTRVDTTQTTEDLARWNDCDNATTALDKAQTVLAQTKRVLGRRIKDNMKSAYGRATKIAEDDTQVANSIKPLATIFSKGADARAAKAEEEADEAQKVQKLQTSIARDTTRSTKNQTKLAKAQALIAIRSKP